MSLKPNKRTEIRRNQYKVAVDAEEGRRRREDDMVEIRKTKREESLMKKRRESLHNISGLVDKKLESFLDIVAGVWSDDPALQLKSTTEFRKFVSMEIILPPIKEVIDSGVVPRFVQFLKKEEYPQIQFEAVSALTNIATGTSDHTKVVIDNNAIPVFVHLLASPNDDVREQAVWALGSIARGSKQCRELVIRCGALVPLLNQLYEYANLSILRIRNVTWTLSNLYCGGQVIPEAVPALKRLIYLNDEEVLTNVCWAFSYLSNGTGDKIQTVIETGVVPRLVQLLRHPSQSVVEPTLRSIGNIVTGDYLKTQVVINSGALPCLEHILIYNYKKRIKKEACWTISNITSGNIEQIQMVLEANLIAPLVKLLQFGEFDVKKEVAWAIYNVTSRGSHDQIKYLVGQGCIKPLCDLLVSLEPKIVSLCLKGLENILKVGEADMNFGKTGDMNYYAYLIDEEEGFEKIEGLQSHENNEISVKAVKLLETYCLDVEDDEIKQYPAWV
ncbi:Importin subunit alpha-1 [Cardamine amara subsp. amara]|uniref:Importin subunit alpha n=1 Tax=Cardamine amara subsp. amara TaxID=228776 RepID=A0ABD0ZL94_CARAN